MRGLIYDLITGMAIIASLFVITDVMKANQKFIATSAIADTKVEQLYMDNNAEDTDANPYTILDVYGLCRNFITTDTKVMDGIKIEITFKDAGDGVWKQQTVSLSDANDPAEIESIDVTLRGRINLATSNETYAQYRYVVDKLYYDSEKRMKYTITQK